MSFTQPFSFTSKTEGLIVLFEKFPLPDCRATAPVRPTQFDGMEDIKVSPLSNHPYKQAGYLLL